MKSKIEVVKLKDLQTNLFVRRALNQNHILYLAELIENGVKLPPIEITTERVVVDGRHRIEAYELNNRMEVEAKVVEVRGETDLIATAYKANVGGALPPTPQDTEHAVMLLLERGESKKKIGELLGLPAGMARRFVNEVQSKLSRAKVQRAAAAVTEGGLTVAKAAEQYGVDTEKLKETLSGGRRKRHRQGIVEIQRGLTKTYKSLGSRNAALVRSLLDKFEDGDVTGKQVRDIFAHIKDLQKRSVRAIADWEKRFSATNGGGAVAAERKDETA